MRLILVLAILLGAAPAPAADRAKPDPNGRVCRKLQNTGTRITSSECHTRAEWVEIDAARLAQFEELRRNLGRGITSDGPVSNSPMPR